MQEVYKRKLQAIFHHVYTTFGGYIRKWNEYIQNLISFLKLGDVVIAYIILVIISLLIANTYSKKLFKKSAMNTYRDEEV